MAKLFNRVKVSTATAGTGTITLGAATSNFYCTFAEAGVANSDVVAYVIEDGTDFEIGIGTYTSAGTTLSRDTVRLSKIGGVSGTTKLTLSGSATVFLCPGKEDIANLGQINDFTDICTFTNTGLHILDTNATHDLIIKPGSDLTADRILTITTGDAARTITLNADTTLSGTNTGDQTVPAAASQANMEAEASGVYVAPNVAKYAPSAAKVWCDWGVTTTINASYNVSSITDNGAGDWTVNFTTSFSTANYSAVVTNQPVGTTSFGATDGFVGCVRNAGIAAASVRVISATNGGGGGSDPADDARNSVACYGDQ